MRIAALAVLLTWALAALPPPAQAQQAPAPHSEEWCADAVDFAMRTAEYRDLGRKRETSEANIRRDERVFHQEYPSLSTAEMLTIARAVYEKHWTHFGAASAMSKACPTSQDHELPAVLTLDHSDEWCANAVDFAMGVAQNRELEFPQELIAGSFDQNPIYYHMQFPELSKDEMLGLTDAVYRKQWTRFGAAANVSGSCRAGVQQSAS
jgi:hypothetical protein